MNTVKLDAPNAPLSLVKSRLLDHLRAGQGGFLLEKAGLSADPSHVSEAQAAILALDALAPASAVTTIGAEVYVEGRVDQETLRAALQAVARRHRMLRASIEVNEKGIPLLSIADDVDPQIRILDVEDNNRLEQVRADFASTTISSMEAPAWQLLIARGPSEDRIFFIAHHAFVDAPSMSIFARALSDAYSQGEVGQVCSSTNVSVSIREDSNAGAEYFTERLSGGPQSLDWPFGRQTSAPPVGPTARATRSIPFNASDRLKEVAKQHDLTVFRLLLNLVGLSLCRLLDSDDVIVGIPVSSRDDHTEIGCFVDIIPHRFSIDERDTLENCVKLSSSRFDADYAMRTTGWRNIISHHRSKGLSEPIIEVSFGSRPSSEAITLGDASANFEPLERVMSATTLVIEWQERQGKLEFFIDFRTDVLTLDEVNIFLDILESTCIRAAEGFDRPLLEMPTLPEASRALQLDEDGFREVPSLDALMAQGSNNATISSTTDRGKSVTSGQIPELATYLCRRFTNGGITEGTRVGVLLLRGVALPIAIFSLLAMRAVYVPLDANHPIRRSTFIADDSGIQTIICDRSTESLAREISVSLGSRLSVLLVDLEDIRANDDYLRSANDGESPCSVDEEVEEQLAYICYTSGSSGQPKGVAVPRRALANLLNAVARLTNFSSTDRLLSTTTLTFDIASLELLLPIVAGAELVVADEETARDPWRLAAAISLTQPTVVQMTPSLLNLVVETGWRGQAELEIWSGGEPLSEGLAAKLHECCRKLYNFYGPTETTIWSTAAQLTKGSPVNIGQPISNTRVYVLDRHRRLRPLGLVGEIAIGGVGVANGYIDREELTSERFIQDPIESSRGQLFLTGDRGLRSLNGTLNILGRRDDQVKVNGHRIELGEIDAALTSLPGILTASSSVVSTRLGGPQIMAALVGTEKDERLLRRLLEEILPLPMVPARLFFVKQVPLTPNGKIDRRAIGELLDNIVRSGEQNRVLDGLEQTQLSLMIDVFNRYSARPAGPMDDFFHLGGDSISLIRLLADVRLAFGTAPTVMTFFQSPRTPYWLLSYVESPSERKDVFADLASLLDEAEVDVVNK